MATLTTRIGAVVASSPAVFVAGGRPPASTKPTSEAARVGRSSASVEGPRRHDLRAATGTAKGANLRANPSAFLSTTRDNAPSTCNRVRLPRHPRPSIQRRSLYLRALFPTSFEKPPRHFQRLPPSSSFSNSPNITGVRGLVHHDRPADSEVTSRSLPRVTATSADAGERLARRQLISSAVADFETGSTIVMREPLRIASYARRPPVRVTRRRTAVFRILRHRRRTSQRSLRSASCQPSPRCRSRATSRVTRDTGRTKRPYEESPVVRDWTTLSVDD